MFSKMSLHFLFFQGYVDNATARQRGSRRIAEQARQLHDRSSDNTRFIRRGSACGAHPRERASTERKRDSQHSTIRQEKAAVASPESRINISQSSISSGDVSENSDHVEAEEKATEAKSRSASSGETDRGDARKGGGG